MRTRLTFRREALLHDISNLAYVVADVGGEGKGAHRLHQTYDICEEGNVERVDSVLQRGFAEVRLLFGPVLEPLRGVGRATGCAPADSFRLLFRRGSVGTAMALAIKERVHEYLVTLALADWLLITLPEAAPAWKERSSECMAQLVKCLNAILYGRPFTAGRRLSPF